MLSQAHDARYEFKYNFLTSKYLFPEVEAVLTPWVGEKGISLIVIEYATCTTLQDWMQEWQEGKRVL